MICMGCNYPATFSVSVAIKLFDVASKRFELWQIKGADKAPVPRKAEGRRSGPLSHTMQAIAKVPRTPAARNRKTSIIRIVCAASRKDTLVLSWSVASDMEFILPGLRSEPGGRLNPSPRLAFFVN